jgi:hypothetical protein
MSGTIDWKGMCKDKSQSFYLRRKMYTSSLSLMT